MRTLSTGVEIIDVVLGGVTPGLPCVLAGPSGSGRTVLGLELAAAALEQGRIVTLLSNEPAPFLLQQARSLGLDLEPALDSERLALLEMDAEIASITSALGAEQLAEALHAEQPLTSLLVVDPFSVITSGIFDEAQLRSTARSFVSGVSAWSTVLTVESERLALQPGLERILGETCGAFARLHKNEDGMRRLVVEKTRTGVMARSEVAFEIGEGGTRLLNSPSVTEPEQAGAHSAQRSPTAARDSRAAASAPLFEHALDSAAPGHEAKNHSISTLRGEEARRPVVLVADGDRAFREQLVKWLEGRYDVIAAEDGFEAMTWLMSQRPDLLILELLMPRVSGYELLSAFQRSDQPVPRLVISGRIKRPGDRLAPLVLGATDILPKPVERLELLHKVDVLLQLQRAPAQLMDPIDAQSLFANVSKIRLLSKQDFHDRLHRACNLGERLALPSSLIAVAAGSAESLDGFLEAADSSLRFEDATVRLSKRRGVLLLVATECADAPIAIERLCERFEEQGGKTKQLSFLISNARRLDSDFDLHRLFREGAETADPTCDDSDEENGSRALGASDRDTEVQG
jgi:DNA-binding response OmpR family regulator/KaiC/GvpD/RAD55 family RecA-like ATPase